MKGRLKIRNFGPIREIDIEINRFTVLIGPHASGKSTISKVLSIIHRYNTFHYPGPDDRNFQILQQDLAYYNIQSFYQENTYWLFEDDIVKYELENRKIIVNAKASINDVNFTANTYYIPAERIALHMISESLFEITLQDKSTLPKFFLSYGNDFIKARQKQKIFNIAILGVEFEHDEGKNGRVVLSNNKSLLLEETSSAIQANLPLLVILQYLAKDASVFVIEELELHSFPELQKKMLYHIADKFQHHQSLYPKPTYVILPTHSPYLLSAANNLLLASKVGKNNKEAASKIIPSKSWIDTKDLSAYYIQDGKASSIVDDYTGLIHENKLDTISEDLKGELDALMELF